MLLEVLRGLSENEQLALVRAQEEYQSWALVERLCEESVVQASRDLGRATFLARLARETARRVPGPKDWVRRVRAFAAAHAANVLRVSGRLKAADALFQKAKPLWAAGYDPDGVLDPGRLLDLEASLRRDQRRFEEALELAGAGPRRKSPPSPHSDQQGVHPGGDRRVRAAIETLLEAEALPDVQADPRLRNILHCNLALNFQPRSAASPRRPNWRSRSARSPPRWETRSCSFV